MNAVLILDLVGTFAFAAVGVIAGLIQPSFTPLAAEKVRDY
jgi:Na+/serine symporter